jgi:predicted nucleic acid-binding protein
MERTDAAPVRTAVLDAGPLIHLDELGCLSLLSDFQELLVPVAVWIEVERHRPTALSAGQILLIKQQAPLPSSALFGLCEAFNLDRGEQEALAVCSLHPGAVLFTDDAAVRLAAKTVEARAYGTLGILIRAIRRRQLTTAEVVRLLEQIPSQSTLYVRKNLLLEIIEEVKKTGSRF